MCACAVAAELNQAAPKGGEGLQRSGGTAVRKEKRKVTNCSYVQTYRTTAIQHKTNVFQIQFLKK